jgi:surface antigen
MRRIAILLLLVLLAACARDQPNIAADPVPSPDALALSPSGGGTAPAPDTLLPADIVDKLQPEDREQVAKSLREALEAERGKRIDWHDPATGASGYSVTLRRGLDPEHHRICSEIRQAIRLQGQRHTATGYACRQPDGSWAIDPGQKQYLRLL